MFQSVPSTSIASVRCTRKFDGVLEFVAQGDGATTHLDHLAGAGTTVDTVAKGGVLPETQIARDRSGENKMVVSGAGEVADNAFCLMPMKLDGGAHVAAEVIDDRGYVRASAFCTIKEFADEFREGKCFSVERD
jgi:hypothetical protein